LNSAAMNFARALMHKDATEPEPAPRPRRQVAAAYLFGSLTDAVGFGCVIEIAVAGGDPFTLSCLGFFFGSRPLRF